MLVWLGLATSQTEHVLATRGHLEPIEPIIILIFDDTMDHIELFECVGAMAAGADHHPVITVTEQLCNNVPWQHNNNTRNRPLHDPRHR